MPNRRMLARTYRFACALRASVTHDSISMSGSFIAGNLSMVASVCGIVTSEAPFPLAPCPVPRLNLPGFQQRETCIVNLVSNDPGVWADRFIGRVLALDFVAPSALAIE